MHLDFDARRDWTDRRQKGDRVAVFDAGAMIRCPALRRTREGHEVICGHGYDSVADGARVTVIADRRATNRHTGAINRKCESCKTWLRIEVDPVAREAA